jgi:hypothetical protein
MRGHIDAEALALCREGLLGRRRTARIRAHLSGCSSCAEVDAGLAEVPSLLTLTSVPAMPAELAARIGAALAAEAASQPAEAAKTAEAAAQAAQEAQEADRAHAAQAAQGTASAVPRVSPGQVPSPASGERTPRGRPGLARKVLALAAAVVLVAAGGGYLLSRPHATSGTSASSAAAPSTARRPAAGAGQSHSAAGSASAGLSFSAISSGTNYQPGQLTAQVAVVLARYPTPAAGTHAAAPTARAATSQVPTEPYDAAASAGCVERIAGGLPPRLVDKARYDGRAATIIVLPASARGPAQVWVVGPACSGARSDVLAHTSLPGPG